MYDEYEEKDAWESGDLHGEFLRGPDAQRLEVNLRFQFIDKNGKITQRDVTTKTFSADDTDGAILAYCHLRGANRVFVMSRMSMVANTDTGEIITNLPK